MWVDAGLISAIKNPSSRTRIPSPEIGNGPNWVGWERPAAVNAFPRFDFGKSRYFISTFAGFRFGARCVIRSAGFRRQVNWLLFYLRIHERGFSVFYWSFLGKSTDRDFSRKWGGCSPREKSRLIFLVCWFLVIRNGVSSCVISEFTQNLILGRFDRPSRLNPTPPGPYLVTTSDEGRSPMKIGVIVVFFPIYGLHNQKIS